MPLWLDWLCDRMADYIYLQLEPTSETQSPHGIYSQEINQELMTDARNDPERK